MIKIKKFEFNPFLENTYLIWDESTYEAMIIDAGCYSSAEEEAIINFIKANPIHLIYMVNTHCHVDHILGNAFIKKEYNPKFLAPENDLFLLRNLIEQAEMFGLNANPSQMPDEYLNENIPVKLGIEVFNFIATPGHTPGGYCLYNKNEKVLFSGDVLFKESIGRTDLPGGDYETISKSLAEKIIVLDNDTNVFPGHGESTTIGNEKLYNPFIKEILRVK